MFYPKKTKEEIEKAKAGLKRELKKELEGLRAVKAERELESFLKGKMEKRWETKSLPPTPQEVREKEKEKMIAEYEEEVREREERFDRMIRGGEKREPPRSSDYS